MSYKNIPLSVQETDSFIDISQGRYGERLPDPSQQRITDQAQRPQIHEQPLSEIWKNITENLWQMNLNCRQLCDHFRLFCFEEPNVCELLLLLGLSGCRCFKSLCKLILVAPGRILKFGRRIFGRKKKTFHSD